MHSVCVRKSERPSEKKRTHVKCVIIICVVVVCAEKYASKVLFHYPFHSRVRIALALRLYDPPSDFVRQMIDPD